MDVARSQSSFDGATTAESRPHLILANIGKLRYKAKVERAHRPDIVRTQYVYQTIKEKHKGYSLTKMLVRLEPASDCGEDISESSSFSSEEFLIPSASNDFVYDDFSGDIGFLSDEDSTMIVPFEDALYSTINEHRGFRGTVTNDSNRPFSFEPRVYRDSFLTPKMTKVIGENPQNPVSLSAFSENNISKIIYISSGSSQDLSEGCPSVVTRGRENTSFHSTESDVLSNISSIHPVNNVTSTSDVLSIVSSIEQVQDAEVPETTMPLET